jgi:predicted O-linked N-acetylglucosamine transferase (SPINDLY family)
MGPLVGLGLLAIRDRRIDEAIDHLEAALALDDSDPEPPMLLGTAYSLVLRPDKAIPMLRLAMQRDPENNGVVNDLAVMLGRMYCYEEAAELLRASIEKNGPTVISLSNLATAKAALGELREAAEVARSAMRLDKRDPRPAYAFCNMLPYQEDISAPYLLAALRDAAATGKRRAALDLEVSRVPDRPLRIGLLSNLLRTHPAGWLTVAGLEALDGREFSIHCFGRFEQDDVLAHRFAGFAASWHKTETMDDLATAQCVRDSKIDILIDLGGFGDAGRIDVCAYRPAPLQVKWVGMQYHSTGLPYIDYFITDHQETPAGYDAFYSEKLLRLPDGYVCYLPPSYAPEVGKLPAERNGVVTFGCLNSLMKFTPSTLAAWAEILHGVPGSRLYLRCTQFSELGPRKRICKFFAEHGIAEERLQLSGRAVHREFISSYNEIDIALDPFPYSGGLSTCEALYMGVPVLTRAGEIFAARHSVSHLANVGMQDWIVATTEAYVAKAIACAGDIPGLAALRAGLRRRVVASPLCDAPRFGKNLGAALRKIWVAYCEGA